MSDHSESKFFNQVKAVPNRYTDIEWTMTCYGHPTLEEAVSCQKMQRDFLIEKRLIAKDKNQQFFNCIIDTVSLTIVDGPHPVFGVGGQQ